MMPVWMVGSSGELTGPAIELCVREGLIEIEPFNSNQVAECSYDMRLGSTYLQYVGDRLDSAKPNEVREYKIGVSGVVLWPGELYLMSTVERIHTDHFKPKINGKSSIARLGVQIHLTAGDAEPGFDGNWTLEVVVAHNKQVTLYAGMLIAQMSFTTLVGERRLYDGNYKGETATGPQPSRSWNQFK